MVCVDDLANAEALSSAAGAGGVELRVLVEVNIGLNRSGVEPGAPAVTLSEKGAALPHLRYAGLMGWEGHLASKPPSPEKRHACEAAVGSLVATIPACSTRKVTIPLNGKGRKLLTRFHHLPAHLTATAPAQSFGFRLEQ